jgi:hypothetical protein
MSPNTRTLMGAAPREEQGVASGALATTRVVGQSLTVALAGSVFAAYGGVAAVAAFSAGVQTLSAQQMEALQHEFVDGLHAAFIVCAAVSALGVLAALVRGKEA